MKFELEEIKSAYIRLKSYIYHDNSDLFLRIKLVEFETNKTKDNGIINYFGGNIPKPYRNKNKKLDVINIFKNKDFTVNDKLTLLTDALNNYNVNPEFIDFFIDQIKINFVPKKIKQNEDEIDAQFISNKKSFDSYEIEKVTTFIDAPLEIHIISVLWILKEGIDLDKGLSESCFGNRLLLNIERTEIVQGSGLFKPYFKQYSKWRDSSVKAAKNILSENKNAMFLNIDVKDYFHSVRIPITDIFSPKKTHYKSANNNLRNIFLKINESYTLKVSKDYKTPYNFYPELLDDKGNLKFIVLPIGLLSSYVLANHYLKDFDKRILEYIQPEYYGRYVDDILLVIANPNITGYEDKFLPELNFDFEKFKSENTKDVNFEFKVLSKLERYILTSFYPVLKIVNQPLNNSNDKLQIKINGFENLFCQSDKSMLYYFDFNESDLVIDKLKKELDQKSSEFRDFPDEEEVNDSFEENAYHLLYEGSDNKITTLKSYKENRYGLTVFLANKIFGSLRHEKKESKDECEKVIKFFNGKACLQYFTLWERIFTYLLVNNQPDLYVKFYLDSISEIKKIESLNSNIDNKRIITSLLHYLDAAHEMTISLNPLFIVKVKTASANFKFKIKQLEDEFSWSWNNFIPTRPNSNWCRRFREANLVRHNYCIHPLMTYTKMSKKLSLDLTSMQIDFAKFELDEQLIKNSPRLVKFGECSLAIAFEELKGEINNIDIQTNIFSQENELKEKKDDFESNHGNSFYLDKVFTLFNRINVNHTSGYFEIDEFKENLFKNDFEKVHENLFIHELSITTTQNISKPRIAFANTEVSESNIIESIKSNPNLNLERYKNLSKILKTVREENAEILLFPENFIPINLLSSIVRFTAKNSVLTITGLEHITIGNKCFNLIATIIPIANQGINDSVVLLRLKNHYSHAEVLVIEGHHLTVPVPKTNRIDIINWNNIYLSPFYCFELANVTHRSLLVGKLDLLIGIEWNKDTNYFSNIVESGSRDLHTFVAQVNTSQFGDTRLTQPTETALKDILRLKGGINDSVLIGTIDINAIRNFQLQKYSLSGIKSKFKPLPPDFPIELVNKRIKNKSILENNKSILKKE